MNENLNLVKILKDVTRGTKLWSPICGDCYFQKIDEGSCTPIVCTAMLVNGGYGTIHFTEEGIYFNSFADGGCALFPSKGNHDWTTFKTPKKHKEFKPFERVLVREWCDCKSIWTASLYSHYDDALDRHCLLGAEHVGDDRIIPYEGNENKVGKYVE